MRATNLEAMHGGLALEAERPSPAASPAPIEVDAAEIEPEIEIESEAAEAAQETAETVADDLTRMVGIGPSLAELLAERGVVTFAQIAAWTDAEVAEIDTALNLKGRASRDAWIAQARRFAAREDQPSPFQPRRHPPGRHGWSVTFARMGNILNHTGAPTPAHDQGMGAT